MNNKSVRKVFIAAGDRNAKQIRNQYQPYIKIAGKTCVERVLEAVYGCELVDEIVLWGEEEHLRQLLSSYLDKAKPVRIYQQKKDVVESFIFCWLAQHQRIDWVKRTLETWQGIHSICWEKFRQLPPEQVHVMVCDTPLLVSKDVHSLIISAEQQKDADLVLGRTNWQAVEKTLQKMKEPFDLNKAIKNTYFYSTEDGMRELIVNGYYGVRPLSFDQKLLQLISDVISNRTIVERGHRNWGKIRDNLKLTRQIFKGRLKSKQLKSMFFLTRAYLHIVKSENQKASKFNSLESVYWHIEQMTNLKIHYVLGDSFGSAFDIDTSYECQYVNQHFEQLLQHSQQ